MRTLHNVTQTNNKTLVWSFIGLDRGLCDVEEVQCSNPGMDGALQCIDRFWLCDDEYDCDDGSDEINCSEYNPKRFVSVKAESPLQSIK